AGVASSATTSTAATAPRVTDRATTWGNFLALVWDSLPQPRRRCERGPRAGRRAVSAGARAAGRRERTREPGPAHPRRRREARHRRRRRHRPRRTPPPPP